MFGCLALPRCAKPRCANVIIKCYSMRDRPKPTPISVSSHLRQQVRPKYRRKAVLECGGLTPLSGGPAGRTEKSGAERRTRNGESSLAGEKRRQAAALQKQEARRGPCFYAERWSGRNARPTWKSGFLGEAATKCHRTRTYERQCHCAWLRNRKTGLQRNNGVKHVCTNW